MNGDEMSSHVISIDVEDRIVPHCLVTQSGAQIRLTVDVTMRSPSKQTWQSDVTRVSDFRH